MAQADTALLKIAESLPAIMRKLFGGRLISSGAWELTIPQLRALTIVSDDADCTMGELARALEISLSAATGLADRLVQQGLLEREFDPDDRRLVCLRLTHAGEHALEACRHERTRRVHAALHGLSAKQQAHIASALALLRDALEASDSAGNEEEPGE
jgi:DNA-binding MarR family transcriptional regulator